MILSRIHSVAAQHRIVYGVVLALIIASLLTMVSMALYVSSGASRLDLSRPGYEKARKEIVKDTDKGEFSPAGPVNSSVLDDVQRRFDKRRSELRGLGGFDSTALDDNQLQITPGEPAPTQLQ